MQSLMTLEKPQKLRQRVRIFYGRSKYHRKLINFSNCIILPKSLTVLFVNFTGAIEIQFVVGPLTTTKLNKKIGLLILMEMTFSCPLF